MTQNKTQSSTQSPIYFTQETEDAIIEYISTDPNDSKKRNFIYENKIQYPFYKLSENIIHTFKFYYTDINTIEELKHEVTTFLLEKLHLYHHSKNINDKLNKFITKIYEEHYDNGSFISFTNNSPVVTQQQINEFISGLQISQKCLEEISKITPPKAYSYFGTIAKRYLIIYNKKNYNKVQSYTGINELDEDSEFIDNTVREYEYENEHKNDNFIDYYIKYVDKNLNKLFPKIHDAKTADAIIELFRKRDTLEIYNKKALYIYIREITDVSTPQITKITKKLDSIRTKLYNEYYKNGFISR